MLCKAYWPKIKATVYMRMQWVVVYGSRGRKNWIGWWTHLSLQLDVFPLWRNKTQSFFCGENEGVTIERREGGVFLSFGDGLKWDWCVWDINVWKTGLSSLPKYILFCVSLQVIRVVCYLYDCEISLDSSSFSLFPLKVYNLLLLSVTNKPQQFSCRQIFWSQERILKLLLLWLLLSPEKGIVNKCILKKKSCFLKRIGFFKIWVGKKS